MFSGILDDFLHYRTTKKNDLRSIALHLALIYQNGNTNNSDLNDQLYNDLQKIIDHKVEFFIPILIHRSSKNTLVGIVANHILCFLILLDSKRNCK